MLFGLRFWVSRPVLLVVALFGLGACAEKPASDLGFGVSFACPGDREASDSLRLRILVGGCESDNEARYEATLARGDQAEPANGVGPGTYGIEATALRDGTLVAYACLVAELPTSQSLDVQLRSENCDADAGEPDADMDGEVPDGGEPDGGSDDAGDAEIEPDAAPIPCETDCVDSDPCTDDSCDTTSGTCKHTPFVGTRECDDIACTEGDVCDEEGVCQPGAANNAACDDDGQVCTAEICTPGVGCTTSLEDADGRECNDNIACTGPDRCANGVCRGADTCASGSVCTVGGSCQVTGCATNCDDGNPCTDNVCAGGVCSNPANTAPCNDGKSCTANDRCTNRVCRGTNTCPSNATCGNFCSCNSAADTLCGNTCVDLNTTASNCGLCERSCEGGASCENSACKPSDATGCTAYRYGGHDYLVCTDVRSWTSARSRCRGWNMGLAAIDSAAENAFLTARIGAAERWIGANDRGDNGNNCTRSGAEGVWYWASATSTNDKATKFCEFASSSATSCTVTPERYQNWGAGEPNNSGCMRDCNFIFVCSGYTDGQDCGIIRTDGTWDDLACNPSGGLGYICESP